MACLDELTLDLWLAGALPTEEAASVATHVRTCAACTAAEQAARATETELQAALALNAEELAYLSNLDLASRWRTRPAAALSWIWIALAGAVGSYVAWLVAAPVFGPLAGTVTQLGLGTLPLTLPLGFAVSLGQGLLEVATHPALGLSQPLLALLAIALLFWPRQFSPQRSTHS